MLKILKIKVTPRGSKTEILSTLPDGTIRIKLAASPVDGAANEALVEFLASEYHIAKSRISIKSGHTSRFKTIVIEN